MQALTTEAQNNYIVLRDCLSSPIINRSAPDPNNGRRKRPKGRKPASSGASTQKTTTEQDSNDAEDLAEFIDYIASELFSAFSPELQALTYASMKNNPHLATIYASPLPPSTLNTLLATLPPTISDSLIAYALLPTPSSLPSFLSLVLNDYITTTTSPPPPLLTTQKASACEICERDWIPLTYHHLIPKSMHKKALKRGWHEEWSLNSVAWLCRACHSFVHRVEDVEGLAREFWSVERLLGREDVKGWKGWVGRVRWKAR